MTIDIPDEWVLSILNFHPTTPIKDAVGMFMRNRTNHKEAVFRHIGERALESFLNDNLSR